MEKFYELKEFILAKKYYVIGGMIFLICLSLSICFSYNKLTKKDEKEIIFLEEEKKEEIVEEEVEKICYVSVDIKGEVINPGLYQVECDSRVQDVIDKAGGITKYGDTSTINLSKKVIDEMVIIIYSKKENTPTIHKKEEILKQESCISKTEIKNDACIEKEDLEGNTQNEDNKEVISDTPVNNLISLNKATKEELMTLSGIGESKANNIIKYRTENGGFKSLEEIKNVKGIGDSIFEKIKNSITL